MPDGQFYGAIIWYHLMAPFYGMCVPGITLAVDRHSVIMEWKSTAPVNLQSPQVTSKYQTV